MRLVIPTKSQGDLFLPTCYWSRIFDQFLQIGQVHAKLTIWSLPIKTYKGFRLNPGPCSILRPPASNTGSFSNAAGARLQLQAGMAIFKSQNVSVSFSTMSSS